MTSIPHYIIPIQTKLENLYSISQSNCVTVFIDGLGPIFENSKIISCKQVLLQTGDREFYLITAEQTEINYRAEIDHLVMVMEKDMPKILSFNPQESPEYIKIKNMKSQSGFKLTTFIEEDYYCKSSSNKLQFTFEAGTAMMLEGENEKLFISCGRTPEELIVTSNTDDIARILTEKELKPYTLNVSSII